ncbi:hypothetical protein ABZS77_23525 [Micromonospora sp. NPDC005298]|uniref:hypothetical protein n=1 Tax=Micromonospora sp. NPDC005298 TaxID=3156873 RepID=UPI0033A49186
MTMEVTARTDDRKGVFDDTVALDDLVVEADTCPCNGPNKGGDDEGEAKADKPVGRTSKDSGAQIIDRWARYARLPGC